MPSFLKFILGMKLCMFWTVPLSIIRSYALHTQQWYMSYRFADSLRAGSGWNAVLYSTFPDKINYVPLHLVGYILDYYYDARSHKR